MKRGLGGRMFFMMIFFAAAFVAVFGFIVMNLWNAILPAVIHVGAITFWQAVGILLLGRILFGGFPGGGWRGRHQWRRRMYEKWNDMTPEQREKLQQAWRER